MAALDLIVPQTFDTRHLAREHQFDAWRALQSSVIDASLTPEARTGFVFEQQVWDLGKLAFAAARMPGPLVPRSWKHLSKDPLDHWCLVLPESGLKSAQVGDGGRREVHFRSLGRPFEGAAADASVTTLFIPRDFFRPIAGILDAHPGTLSPDGLGGLLADFLISLERRLPAIATSELPNLLETMRAMIAACFAPNPDRLAEAHVAIASTVLERARQAIHRQLYSPSLSPDSLCRQLGISRSKLYLLFEPLRGVGRYIQRQRLLAAHRELSDLASTRNIAELAEQLCFSDAATFSRAFRNEFGCAPSDIRAAARMGWSPTPNVPRIEPSAPLTNLGDILRRLQV